MYHIETSVAPLPLSDHPDLPIKHIRPIPVALVSIVAIIIIAIVMSIFRIPAVLMGSILLRYVPLLRLLQFR